MRNSGVVEVQGHQTQLSQHRRAEGEAIKPIHRMNLSMFHVGTKKK
ncbi:hypothetical protein CBM2634_A170110 [Cupriavidus taiwanensis]|uniref:Uncharacterized protein n=1 Tax=Cupriavidus taiwanensis TaxID=164546 RepID=A0A375IZQ9_9BURK|nr:hypothetical protein CBM2634_A170110 [Cupriavidus taiwanensis]